MWQELDQPKPASGEQEWKDKNNPWFTVNKQRHATIQPKPATGSKHCPVVSTGEWTVERVREIYDRMCCTVPYGSIDDFFAWIVREVGHNQAVTLGQHIARLEDQLAAAVEALRQIATVEANDPDEVAAGFKQTQSYEIARAALAKAKEGK